MNDKSEVLESLSNLIKRKTKEISPNSILCTVKTLDLLTKTIYCESIDNTGDVQKVRYQPDINVDGFVIVPKEGSTVVVSFTESGTAYISMFSEVYEIHIAGVSYGGLAKTEDIKNKLNNIENKINALITVFNSWVVAPGDGGGALKTALTTWVSSNLTLTTQGAISSGTVYHGDNT